MVATVIVAMASAFLTGALARFAVPGPDPMPAWLTIAIGLAGTAIGTGIVIGIDGRKASAAGWAGIASFLAAIALVLIYRRFVQKRALWGPEAYRFPERGVGVEHARERLKRAGIDPDQIGVGMPFGAVQPMPTGQQPAQAPAHEGPHLDATENPAHYLGLLEELHDAGVLDDEQFASARTKLLERLRG
jgi:uncharacterized membrane protein YeaQ/YmgE (transglycosylase-associated protein family)